MVNSQYKDATIKLFLKSEKGRLIRLVNSIRGTAYPEDMPIAENTLETPVFMAAHNDLSFCYDNDVNLVLIEHQSTINENMAVRMLMYLGRVYEKILHTANIYATRRIPLPAPYFIVLYNGTAKCPEVQTLRLSDAFGVPNSEIELLVHMYNINYNEEDMPQLLRENFELREYAAFIQRAREYMSEGYELKDAIKKAISDFRNTEVMGPFLETNASEVLNMLVTEWNTAEFGKVQRAEGRAEGRVEGLVTGRIEMACQSIKAMISHAGKTFDEVAAMLCLSEEEAAACRAQLNM